MVETVETFDRCVVWIEYCGGQGDGFLRGGDGLKPRHDIGEDGAVTAFPDGNGHGFIIFDGDGLGPGFKFFWTCWCQVVGRVGVYDSLDEQIGGIRASGCNAPSYVAILTQDYQRNTGNSGAGPGPPIHRQTGQVPQAG